MEPTELPPLWALDLAAKAAGCADWDTLKSVNGTMSALAKSVISHARTLAKYETPPVDPAELKRWQDAREFAARGYDRLALDAQGIIPAAHYEECAAKVRAGEKDDDKAVYAIYEYACHRDGVEPQDKAPGA